MSRSSEAEDMLEMAREELEQVRIMDDAGVAERKLWSSLYYALFYAADGALLALGYEPRSHRGVNVLVGKVLYQERGLIEKATASFYSEMRRLREDLDYSPHAVLPERELSDANQRADAFVESMGNVVTRRGSSDESE